MSLTCTLRRGAARALAVLALLTGALVPALPAPGAPLPGAAPAPDPVHVNQIGYTPGEPKWVAVGASADSFAVHRADDDAVVHTGPLTLRRAADPASGDDVYEGDFTGLDTPGRYRIHVGGAGDSPEFDIRETVWDDLYRDLVLGLHFERCGIAIPPAVGGIYTHDACHDEGGGIASYDWATTGGAPGGYRNTAGGHHDAGDYGKYMTNNAYTMGVLLQAYLRYPGKYAHDDCGIAESGNGVPDLLDEARWNLEWMLTMQDGGGGVRHREAVPHFTGEYLPENDPETRYYTSVTSDATAAHCGAMALAARVFSGVDPGFAAACSASAASSWAWLAANPARVPPGGFANQYGHTSATYVGGEDVGHRIFAAAEMFTLTGDPSAAAYVDAHWGDGLDFNGVWYPDGWGALANMGAFAYRDASGATGPVVSGNWWSVENSTLSSCAGWAARVDGDGYACAASAEGAYGDYYWGFTGVILRYAWTLLEGYRYGGNPAYEAAAREQLHYILGRNPLGKVYATGLGTRPVLHSHGAWNAAAGFTAVEDSLCHPVPYWLVGGPNAQGNGDISPYPGRCYEDIADPDYYNQGNWTLNETSINIQAAFLVLAGYFGTGGAVTAVPGSPGPGLRPVVSASPNPFTATTTVRWDLETGGTGRLLLLDAAGRRLRIWEPGNAAGVRWDGRDARGRPVPAGVYFLRMESPAGSARGRLVKLR